MKWVNRPLTKPLIIHLSVFILLGLGAYYLFATAYFTDLNTKQPRDNEIIAPFDGGHEYGQGFIARKPYLALVELSFLTSGSPRQEDFEIILRLTDEKQVEIARARYDVPHSNGQFNLRFAFQPQKDSLDKKYYLVIQTDAPSNIVSLVGSNYDAYPGGELAFNDNLTANDLAFFTYSKPSPFLLLGEIIHGSFARLTDILLIGLAFFCLGFLVTGLLLRSNDPIETVVYPMLVGIAIPPVILFLLSLIGVKLTKFNLLVVLLALAIPSLIIFFTRKRQTVSGLTKVISVSQESIILLVLFSFAILTRVSQINDVIVPSGVGSFAHQKLLERIAGREQIPLDSIYHLGFHSNALLVYLFDHKSLPESTLLWGQWLSIVSGLSFHVLARKIFRDPIAALLATSLYWFVSPIPAYLINIGRYPFLQAITLLPAALALLWDHFRFHTSNKTITIIMLLGLLLSHYGTLIVLAVFLFGSLLLGKHLQSPWLADKNKFFTMGIILVPLVLVLMIKSYYVVYHGTWSSFTQQSPMEMTVEDYRYIFAHTLRHGGGLLWLLGISGAIFLFTRHPYLFPFAILCSFVLYGLNLSQMILFGHSASRLTNILFFLAIPISLLGAYTLKVLSTPSKQINYLFIFAITVAGAYNISGVVNPRNVFFSSADREALDWIKDNIPSASTILINSYPWDGEYKPTDSGGWIASWTERTAIFPTAKYEYEDIDDFIRQSRVDYIYLGVGYGDLTPFNMQQRDKNLLYNKNGIYIYEVNKQTVK